MSFEVEATYENGVLKLDEPLPLQEHERVTVHVEAKSDRGAPRVPAPEDAEKSLEPSTVIDDEQAIWDELDRTAMTYEERDELWKHFQSRKSPGT